MKISIDGGALCTADDRRFGNFTFTNNLLQAFYKFDQDNKYVVYSFCKKPAWLIEKDKFRFKILKPKHFWLSTRVSIEEMKERKDIFLALNQAIPLRISGKTISFSHGLSYHLYPQLYPDSAYALEDELKIMLEKSKYMIVSSRKVKLELMKFYSNPKKIIVVPYGIPFDMINYKKRMRKKIFIYAGMNHPIKNIDFIIKAFKEFKKEKKYAEFKLYLAGNFYNLRDKLNDVIVFSSIERSKLQKLYAEATAYLTASYYESFNFPVLEALSQNCPVIGLKSAIIPELKPYVFVSEKNTDFMSNMKKVASGHKIKYEIKVIQKMFSWQKYINKLKILYEN